MPICGIYRKVFRGGNCKLYKTLKTYVLFLYKKICQGTAFSLTLRLNTYASTSC